MSNKHLDVNIVVGSTQLCRDYVNFPTPVWIMFRRGYMYGPNESLLKTIWQFITQQEDDCCIIE